MTLTISSTQRAVPSAPDRRVAHAFGDTTAAITIAERLVTGFGGTAQTLFAAPGRSDTVRAVVDLAVPTFSSDAVGVVLLTKELRPVSAGASGDDAATADRRQLSLRQGPAVQAIERHQPVLVSELRSDSRWRFWAPMAADLGFRSVMVLPLADGDIVGALNLYSRSASTFHSADLVSGMVFAQLASIAIAVAQEREQLLQAVKSRSVIGQAQGILMEFYGVTGPQAMTVLRRYSTKLDLDLTALAEGVIRDRGLPSIESVDPSTAR